VVFFCLFVFFPLKSFLYRNTEMVSLGDPNRIMFPLVVKRLLCNNMTQIMILCGN